MLSETEINMKRLKETLIRGSDSTKRLHNMLRRKTYTDGAVSVEDLATEILKSFSGGLFLLNSCDDSGEFSGVPASSDEGLAGSGDKLPEVYTGKKPAPAVKERRGCYKRRRTTDSRVEIRASMEDNYAWRKYGQKEILNSKFPRCYFRCTHKTVHGCKALKQVQKLEEMPDLFHITYFGQHSCPSPNNYTNPRFILDFNDSKNHINFSNSPSTITTTQAEPSIKQEAESKAQSTDASSDNVSSVNDQGFRWDDMLMDGMDSAFMRFDHHDQDSCASTSPHDFSDIDDVLVKLFQG